MLTPIKIFCSRAFYATGSCSLLGLGNRFCGVAPAISIRNEVESKSCAEPELFPFLRDLEAKIAKGRHLSICII